MVALVPGEDTPQPNEHPSDPNDIFALCSNPHPFDPNFTAGEHAPVVAGGTPPPSDQAEPGEVPADLPPPEPPPSTKVTFAQAAVDIPVDLPPPEPPPLYSPILVETVNDEDEEDLEDSPARIPPLPDKPPPGSLFTEDFFNRPPSPTMVTDFPLGALSEDEVNDAFMDLPPPIPAQFDSVSRISISPRVIGFGGDSNRVSTARLSIRSTKSDSPLF